MNLLGNLFHKESHQHKQSYDFGQVRHNACSFDTAHTVQILGQGGFGIVSQAHDKETDKDVAIKKVPKRMIKSGLLTLCAHHTLTISLDRDAYRRLLNFMRDEMDHPNTIHLIEWFSSSTSYYLVFELASGGDLIDRINLAGGYCVHRKEYAKKCRRSPQ